MSTSALPPPLPLPLPPSISQQGNVRDHHDDNDSDSDSDTLYPHDLSSSTSPPILSQDEPSHFISFSPFNLHGIKFHLFIQYEYHRENHITIHLSPLASSAAGHPSPSSPSAPPSSLQDNKTFFSSPLPLILSYEGTLSDIKPTSLKSHNQQKPASASSSSSSPSPSSLYVNQLLNSLRSQSDAVGIYEYEMENIEENERNQMCDNDDGEEEKSDLVCKMNIYKMETIGGTASAPSPSVSFSSLEDAPSPSPAPMKIPIKIACIPFSSSPSHHISFVSSLYFHVISLHSKQSLLSTYQLQINFLNDKLLKFSDIPHHHTKDILLRVEKSYLSVLLERKLDVMECNDDKEELIKERENTREVLRELVEKKRAEKEAEKMNQNATNHSNEKSHQNKNDQRGSNKDDPLSLDFDHDNDIQSARLPQLEKPPFLSAHSSILMVSSDNENDSELHNDNEIHQNKNKDNDRINVNENENSPRPNEDDDDMASDATERERERRREMEGGGQYDSDEGEDDDEDGNGNEKNYHNADEWNQRPNELDLDNNNIPHEDTQGKHKKSKVSVSSSSSSSSSTRPMNNRRKGGKAHGQQDISTHSEDFFDLSLSLTNDKETQAKPKRTGRSEPHSSSPSLSLSSPSPLPSTSLVRKRARVDDESLKSLFEKGNPKDISPNLSTSFASQNALNTSSSSIHHVSSSPSSNRINNSNYNNNIDDPQRPQRRLSSRINRLPSIGNMIHDENNDNPNALNENDKNVMVRKKSKEGHHPPAPPVHNDADADADGDGDVFAQLDTPPQLVAQRSFGHVINMNMDGNEEKSQGDRRCVRRENVESNNGTKVENKHKKKPYRAPSDLIDLD